MSFFKDFKADFAQAMNELLPDSDEMENEYDDEDMVNTFDEPEVMAEAETTQDKGKKEKKDKKEKNNKKKLFGTESTQKDAELEIAPEDLLENGDGQFSLPIGEPEIAPDDQEANIADSDLDELLDILGKSPVKAKNEKTSKMDKEEAASNMEEGNTEELPVEKIAKAIEEAAAVAEEPKEMSVEEKAEEVLPEEKTEEAEVEILPAEDVPQDISEAEAIMEEQAAEEKSETEAEQIPEPAVQEVEPEMVQEKAEINKADKVEEKKIMENQEEKIIDVAKVEKAVEAKVEETDVQAADDANTYITKGTTISGDIATDGSIDIIGTVNGNVNCKGKVVVGGKVAGNIAAGELYANAAKIEGDISSSGSVKVGVGSVIVGKIEAASAVIAGAVNGDIDVQGPVIVDSTAVIMGNIKSRSVQINNGAVIEGFCSQCYAEVDVKSFFA